MEYVAATYCIRVLILLNIRVRQVRGSLLRAQKRRFGGVGCVGRRRHGGNARDMHMLCSSGAWRPCPPTTTYVSAYYCICPHTACICSAVEVRGVRVLRYMSLQHVLQRLFVSATRIFVCNTIYVTTCVCNTQTTALYVSAHRCCNGTVCVRILLYMCPHTTI